jgi:flagellar protein FliS
MSNLAPPRAYRESAVLSAQPEQLIVMLYDGARRFLGQAAVAMGDGQVELAHRKLRRTEDILLHLREVLDMEQGGEIATRLQSIYLFCQRDARRAARRLGDDRAAAMSAPYERLADSFELELELVGAGRLDELAQLTADREALISTLPATPPASARPALERAALMSKRVMIEITRRRDAIVADLGRVAQADRTARGYLPNRQRRLHIDASA